MVRHIVWRQFLKITINHFAMNYNIVLRRFRHQAVGQWECGSPFLEALFFHFNIWYALGYKRICLQNCTIGFCSMSVSLHADWYVCVYVCVCVKTNSDQIDKIKKKDIRPTLFFTFRRSARSRFDLLFRRLFDCESHHLTLASVINNCLRAFFN